MACCLCKDSLPANHRKRKRVQSCPAAVSQLEKLCSEVGRSLSEIVFCNKQLICFCSSCERDLTGSLPRRVIWLLSKQELQIRSVLVLVTPMFRVQVSVQQVLQGWSRCCSLQSELECLPNDSILTEQKKDPLNLSPAVKVLC